MGTTTIQAKETLSANYQNLYKKFRISYKIFALNAEADVTKTFQAGAITYKCDLQMGETVEIKKVKGEWIEISIGKVTRLSIAIGHGIDAVYGDN